MDYVSNIDKGGGSQDEVIVSHYYSLPDKVGFNTEINLCTTYSDTFV